MTVPATMKAGLYYGSGRVGMVEQPVPAIGPREVLASVEACGICGSDTMQWYRDPRAKNGGINTGHEIAGRVVQAGEGVEQYRPGQRVVITHHFPCLECAPCRDGNETACESMAVKHIDPGGFAQFVRIKESGLRLGIYPLPDTMSYAAGSFVEPLGCVVRSLRKTEPVEGRSVLVVGSGLSGLLHIRLARALGAGRIYAVDMNTSRLEAAVRSGADEAILATEGLPVADRVFVCTGSEKAAAKALDCVARGGHLMFFAVSGPDTHLSIPLTRYWITQQSILFSYGAAPRDMKDAMEHIASGRVPVDDLVTHRFPLEQIGEAFELAIHPKDTSLKVVIEPHQG